MRTKIPLLPQKQQITERLLIGCGAVLILLLLIILVRGCSARKNGAIKTNASAKSQDETSASDADLTPTPTMAPVSLTVSVVGDCTLGTDENFDYDTSLNAYYENYGADYFFSNVKSIFSADDLTIANFEGTLTDSEIARTRSMPSRLLLNMPAFLPPVLSKLSTLPTTTATIMEIRAMRIPSPHSTVQES